MSILGNTRVVPANAGTHAIPLNVNLRLRGRDALRWQSTS